MPFGRLVALSIVLLAWSADSGAQPGNRYLDMESRVLDSLFPLNVAQAKPYKWKIVLRFTDSASQVTLVSYAAARIEVLEHQVVGMEEGGIGRFVAKLLRQDASVSERRIAAQLKVKTTRTSIDREALSPLIDELRRIAPSPVLEDRGGTNFARYEFWYDTWQEAVHFTVLYPWGSTPLDGLAAWMRKCREEVSPLLRASK